MNWLVQMVFFPSEMRNVHFFFWGGNSFFLFVFGGMVVLKEHKKTALGVRLDFRVASMGWVICTATSMFWKTRANYFHAWWNLEPEGVFRSAWGWLGKNNWTKILKSTFKIWENPPWWQASIWFCVAWVRVNQVPIGSMYDRFTHIWLIFMVNWYRYMYQSHGPYGV